MSRRSFLLAAAAVAIAFLSPILPALAVALAEPVPWTLAASAIPWTLILHVSTLGAIVAAIPWTPILHVLAALFTLSVTCSLLVFALMIRHDRLHIDPGRSAAR